MSDEQSNSSGYTKEEVEEAQAVADNLLKLWNSSERRKYRFGEAFHAFGESDYVLKIGFDNAIGWAAYMGISTESASLVRRIYRKLTIQRGIPVSDYEQLDLAKTDGLMALIDAGPNEDLYREALEIGAKTNLATWRDWIDGAVANINAGTEASSPKVIGEEKS